MSEKKVKSEKYKCQMRINGKLYEGFSTEFELPSAENQNELALIEFAGKASANSNVVVHYRGTILNGVPHGLGNIQHRSVDSNEIVYDFDGYIHNGSPYQGTETRPEIGERSINPEQS